MKVMPAPSVQETFDQMLGILRTSIDRLEVELSRGIGVREYDPKLASESGKLARSMSTLIREYRGLERDNIEAANQLTLAQKTELMVEFWSMLPPEHQKKLLLKIQERSGGGKQKQLTS